MGGCISEKQPGILLNIFKCMGQSLIFQLKISIVQSWDPVLYRSVSYKNNQNLALLPKNLYHIGAEWEREDGRGQHGDVGDQGKEPRNLQGVSLNPALICHLH
jgi:hypothetical protein